jgi:hypothetical protein
MCVIDDITWRCLVIVYICTRSENWSDILGILLNVKRWVKEIQNYWDNVRQHYCHFKLSCGFTYTESFSLIDNIWCDLYPLVQKLGNVVILMYTDETVLVLSNPTLLKTLWQPLDVCSWLEWNVPWFTVECYSIFMLINATCTLWTTLF